MPEMSRQLPDWLNQNSPVVAPIPQAPQMPAGGGMMGAPKKKRGFFDKLADAGMAWSAGMGVPSAMRFMEMEEERRRDDARRQQLEYAYGRKRDDDWADFVRKEQFERANPKPVNNDTVADYNFIASQLGPDEARQYLRNRADPIVNIPLPGGDVYMGPRSGMGALGGGASPTPAPATRPPENILQGGASTGLISPEEADVVRQSLGPNGQSAFDGWARENGVRVGKRLSNGQTAYFINGKWYDNPEGR